MSEAQEKGLTDYEREVLHGFPVLSQEELDLVNDMYKPYVFYQRNKTRRAAEAGWDVWCTSCHRHEFMPFLVELDYGERQSFLQSRHNDEVCCPFCGARATLKEKSRCKSFEKLWEENNVVFFHAVGDSLYVQTYWTHKWYKDMPLEAYPQYSGCIQYFFRLGEVMQFYVYYGNYVAKHQVIKLGKRWEIEEPFRGAGLYPAYLGYQTIGLETAIASSSVFRWCQLDKWMKEKNGSLMRYLTAYCLYPRAVEMLMKNGMSDAVRDLVVRAKKNAGALKWNETDPRRAFGLTGSELKEFMALPKHDVEFVAAYKKLRRHNCPISFEQIKELNAELWSIGLLKFIDTANRWHTTPVKFRNYLNKFVSPHKKGGGCSSLPSAFRWWSDYIDAAMHIGYDLNEAVVIFPKKLFEAHDNATAEYRRRLAAERELQRLKAERQRAEDKKKWDAENKKRLEAEKAEREKRANKYTWSDGQFIIRPAENSDEIISEGKALKHCVAGYAERHADGKLTICFMRPVTAPDKPFLTIEISSGKLAQIHGYKNECDEHFNRIAPDPRETYSDILNAWLAWISAGSKRDKDGNPIQPKKKNTKRSDAA